MDPYHRSNNEYYRCGYLLSQLVLLWHLIWYGYTRNQDFPIQPVPFRHLSQTLVVHILRTGKVPLVGSHSAKSVCISTFLVSAAALSIVYVPPFANAPQLVRPSGMFDLILLGLLLLCSVVLQLPNMCISKFSIDGNKNQCYRKTQGGVMQHAWIVSAFPASSTVLCSTQHFTEYSPSSPINNNAVIPPNVALCILCPSRNVLLDNVFASCSPSNLSKSVTPHACSLSPTI